MTDQHDTDQNFNATTARLLRREAVRRAAQEVSTMTGPGLENALSRISAEVTLDAVERQADAMSKTGGSARMPREPH